MGVASGCLFLRAALTGDWDWLRSPWFRIGLAWWAWVVFCSLPLPAYGLGLGGTSSLVQALVTLRFLLFVAALEYAVLRTDVARHWLQGLIIASALYIAIHALFQSVTGYNFYGEPRGGDGELTGPFGKPRAGPPESRILFPALVPPVAVLLARRDWRGTMGAFAVLLFGLGIMVLIGQRMPLLLTLFGLLIGAFLLPKIAPGRSRSLRGWRRPTGRNGRRLATDLLPAGAEILGSDGPFSDQPIRRDLHACAGDRTTAPAVWPRLRRLPHRLPLAALLPPDPGR